MHPDTIPLWFAVAWMLVVFGVPALLVAGVIWWLVVNVVQLRRLEKEHRRGFEVITKPDPGEGQEARKE